MWCQIEDHGTSHFCIVDADRYAVSCNYPFSGRINLSLASRIVLNNEMGDFSFPKSIPTQPSTHPSKFYQSKQETIVFHDSKHHCQGKFDFESQPQNKNFHLFSRYLFGKNCKILELYMLQKVMEFYFSRVLGCVWFEVFGFMEYNHRHKILFGGPKWNSSNGFIQ